VCAFALSFGSFERRVARAFESAEIRAPTRVFARPMVLRAGDRPSIDAVRGQLDRTGYERSSSRSPAIGRYRLSDSEWSIGRRPLRIGAFFDPGGRTTIRLDGTGRIRSITDADGDRLAGVVLDPEEVAAFRGPRGRDRVDVRLEDVPDHLIQAILTTEDRRFRDHAGFDPKRIVGAFLANIREGRLSQGGSTVTQQLARTLFLTTDRTILRKFREAAIAYALERRFSKDRLLTAYLNNIYLGQLGGTAIHGVGRAARFFFDKDVSELELPESAMIAGIIRGPSLYSPHRHPDRARARRDLVLHLMHDEGLLDDEALEASLAADVPIAAPEGADGDARWYFDYLESELSAATTDPGGAGLTVVSTLEPGLQEAAERVVRDRLAWLERIRPRLAQQAQPLQAALVAIDPWTGEVVAMVGGRSYATSQFNRATEARRQPGSAFKPIVLMSALRRDAPRPYTLASVLDDEPLEVRMPTGPWSPSNWDREFHGPVSLREAIEGSRNVPFARLGLEIGPERIVETARRLGIESPLAPYPSLALGASEVSLLELTGAYAVFAAEGERTAPHAIRSVLDARGEVLDGVGGARTEEALTPSEAYLVTSALRGVVDSGTGTAVREIGYRGPVAAKSGTTNGSRDAWFVGYTPELVVGVWVGFDDGTPVGLTGSQAALPIFTDFLRAALGAGGGADFRIPDGVEWHDVPVSTDRGLACAGHAEVFLAGTAPRSPCDGFDRWRGIRGFRGDGLDEAEQWLRGRLDELERRTRVESGRSRRSGRD